MYHARAGWFFELNEDGSVRVVHKEGPLPEHRTIDVVDFSRDEWLSIVAATTKPQEVAVPPPNPE